jgi:hypothetical protein
MQEELAIKDKLLFSTYLLLLVLISVNLLYTKTETSVYGLVIVLAGIPFYYLMKKKS